LLTNKNKLDVVVIAIKRPEILRLCLETFKKNLLQQFDVRVIINVDPVGEENYSQKDIINIAKEYFPNVVSRTPKKGNFSKAVYWAWGQVRTDFFFHLEDDWLLKSFIPAYRLESKASIREIVSITFNTSSNKKYPKLYKNYHLKNFSLRPCIFRTKYIKEKLVDFKFDQDPEKQIIKNVPSKSFRDPKFILYGNDHEGRKIIDTGKKWKMKNAFLKWGKKSDNIVYKKSENSHFFKTVFYEIKYWYFITYWRLRYC
jgi:hypothetical protein